MSTEGVSVTVRVPVLADSQKRPFAESPWFPASFHIVIDITALVDRRLLRRA
ncbi:hypothetical protein MYA98_12275 [Salmonella sp. WGH-01]|nr:hypothetical protein MYA98_12275 [Salmonella sp. WGH-01]